MATSVFLKVGESIQIGADIVVLVKASRASNVRLAVQHPHDRLTRLGYRREPLTVNPGATRAPAIAGDRACPSTGATG